ncbi:MAG: ferrous iron transport protein B [Prevotellaceae bacterium]|jgi:ferrous iron transport protein B|nr:ferrous iron transport protein B [Prevotellaceae bacterium]
MRLSELQTGEKCTVVRIVRRGTKAHQHKTDSHKHDLFGRRNRNDAFCNRIAEMGFVRGQEIEVILNAPLKDPVKYKIMGYEVSLRRSEAAMIEVIRITCDNANEKPVRDDSHGTITENENQEITVKTPNTITVALVGNPNSGKSSLFNFAAKEHEHVGNYGGVTVAAKASSFNQGNYHFNIVDLPGAYSLTAYTPEEVFVRKHIADKKADVIVNVIDASNLERNLYLTTQLIDMNLRVVIALNMYDEFLEKGNSLDYISLSKMIGIPVVPTVARTGKGIKELFDVVAKVYEEYVSTDFASPADEENMPIYKTAKHIHINHGKEIEYSISKIKEEILKNEDIRKYYSTRFLSIKLLENDHETEKVISLLNNADTVFEIRDRECERIKTILGENTETAITNAKYGFIAGALRETLKESNKETAATTKFIDNIVTNKWLGFPMFALFVYLMFEATFNLGQYPMDWIEAGVDWLKNIMNSILSDGPLKDLLIEGIIVGVGQVIVFLPNILILYFFISFMEDSGYMARAAFIMDKLMRKAGLNGKSFIPLIMGFGCNVPAIMSARTIESRSSRMITILVNPFISCSARLPVYMLFVSAFFAGYKALVLFLIYSLGICVTIVMAKFFKRFFFKKEETPFVIELPPYRMPTVKSVRIHMWEKGKHFLKKAGTIILLASVIIWGLQYFSPHKIKYSHNYDLLEEQVREKYKKEIEQQTKFLDILSLTEQNLKETDYYQKSKIKEKQEQSFIGYIGKFIEPVIKPLGFNWKLGVAIVSGLPAKEVVISTLGVLYSDVSKDKLSAVMQNDLQQSKNHTALIAIVFMVFVLLYFPCITAITTIRNETGSWKWAMFSVGYTLALAWIISFAVYRAGLLII